MPELTRNQQFFLLQPPPHSQQQLKKETNHLNCFLPFQLNSNLVNTTNSQPKQAPWPTNHLWNTSISSTTITSTAPLNTHNNTNTTSYHHPLQEYSSSSSSCCSSCSSCCPSPKPSPSANMNFYPVIPINYISYDYQSDCDIICVIDFEANCENNFGRRTPNDAIMEIIEFPVFFVDTRTRSVISTFHEYVRPVIHPKLSPFCTQLTGITQHMVDQADIFPRVLERFEKCVSNLLRERGYATFAIATDGPWDIAHFFARSCKIHGLEVPAYAKRWINLKRAYADCYQVNPICLDNMLNTCGVQFSGRRHSGYYDALAITKLMLKLFHDGASLCRNEMITWEPIQGRKCWGNMDCGYIPTETMYAIRYY